MLRLRLLPWLLAAVAVSHSPWNPYPISGPQFRITDFGAVGDNSTLCTAPIADAFAACRAAGGGYVEVPYGVFVTGTVRLVTACYLLLQPGGVLQGSTDPAEYGADWDYWAVVVGGDVANTGIVGPKIDELGGEIRGTMWQMVNSYDPATNSFIAESWEGVAGCKDTVCRPGNIAINDAENITVSAIRITESSGWTQLFRRVNNFLQDHVSVEGSVQWGTADGMDVESGHNLTFRNSVFKTGDDCLAFRSGAFNRLRSPWPAGPIQGVSMVRISNMTLTSSSSAIKFELNTLTDRTDTGDVSDVIVDGVRIAAGTNRGIGIWHRTAGGQLKDMSIRNVESVTRFDPKPNFWGAGEPLYISTLPGAPSRAVHNITFENVSAVAENGAFFSALTDDIGQRAITGLRLTNVNIAVAKTGNATRPLHDYRPCRSAELPETIVAKVDGIFFENVFDVEIDGGSVRFEGPPQPYWSGACLNATGPMPHVGPGWACHNMSIVAV